MVQEAIRKADVLIEALPYIRKFHKKIFIIKYGGSILGEERVRRGVLEDVAFLRYAGIRPIIVHGGGPNITERLRQDKIETEFVDGMRVTDRATLKIVEEELDNLNDLITQEIESHGVKAHPFKKKDALLYVEKKESDTGKDLGFVGKVTGFNKKILDVALFESIPIICPMGVLSKKTGFNINADEVACFMAKALGAEKLVLLTDVLGVMRDPKNEDSLISTVTLNEVEELISEGMIGKGMIPKVRAAASAIDSGVKKAHIVDAKIPHALLLEIFTNQGIGTEIVK